MLVIRRYINQEWVIYNQDFWKLEFTVKNINDNYCQLEIKNDSDIFLYDLYERKQFILYNDQSQYFFFMIDKKYNTANLFADKFACQFYFSCNKNTSIVRSEILHKYPLELK